MTLVDICTDIEERVKMVKRFVTKARMRKFETQLRNTIIELSFLRRRVEELENEIFEEEEDDE